MLDFLKKLLTGSRASLYFAASFFKVFSLLFELITIFTIIPVFQGNNFNYSLFFLPKFMTNLINDSLSNISAQSALYFFLIVGVSYTFTRLLGNIFTNELYKILIRDLRNSVFDKVSDLKVMKDKSIDPSHLNHLITVDAKNIARSVITTIEFYPILFMILSSVFFTLKYSLYIMFAVIVFFLIILIIYILYSNKIERYSHITYDHSVNLNKMSKNFFYNLKYFKINNYIDYFMNKMKRESKENYDAFFVVERSRDIISFSYETLGIVFIFSFFMLVLHLDKNLGNAIFIIILFYRISPGIVNIQSKMISIRLGITAHQKFSEIENYLRELSEKKIEDKSFNQFDILIKKGEIDISSIGQKFNLNNEIVLNTKRAYLLKGPSGAGKSSFIDLILGHYPVDQKVFINSQDIKDISDKDLGGIFSYVSDFVQLVDGTIRENLCFGYKFSEQRLEEIIQLSGFDKILKEKDLNLNSMINPFEMVFSSGELQRLSIARVLLKDCHYFILDEAMNNLDIESEKMILENIRKSFPDKGFIYISHRSGLDEYFDEVIDVDNGNFNFRG